MKDMDVFIKSVEFLRDADVAKVTLVPASQADSHGVAEILIEMESEKARNMMDDSDAGKPLMIAVEEAA